MALIAMTVSDTVDYVSYMDPCRVKEMRWIDEDDHDKGEIDEWVTKDGATVFKLRPLDVFLMGYIYDNASVLGGIQGSTEMKIHTRVNQTNIDAVRFGLAGFESFADAKGGKIEHKTQREVVNSRSYEVVHDDVMNKLGIRLIQELAQKIKDISEVQPQHEKNGGRASLPSA